MKYILQIPAHLYIGGVEKVARDIGMFANPDKYEIHYIVFDEEIGDYERELSARGCKIFHLQEPSMDYIKFFRDLKSIMSETKYDVIHAHTMFNMGWSMMIAKHMGVPIRVAHAHSALDTGGGLKVKLYEAVMRFLILRDATDFIACGEKAGIRLYGQKAYKERANLILNGIDVERFKFNAKNRDKIRKKYGINKNFVIGHAGHLVDVKNQRFLIELLPEIIKKRPEAVLLLLGEGPDRQMLEETVCKLQLQDNVIFTGNVSNVYDYLSAMDVFAFPSLYEGMPLSVIEVQANGLPCILSTGVPEDVYLSDLIKHLDLKERSNWIETICSAKRSEPSKYASILSNSGVDSGSAMRKIYAVYEENYD